MTHPDPPQPIGEPYQDDTVEEPCPKCGVVQEMPIMVQEYKNAPDGFYPDKECPVCGHDIEDPW